jgi:hypothetical protein
MKSEKSILSATMDPDLVRAIHGRQLLAYEQGGWREPLLQMTWFSSTIESE